MITEFELFENLITQAILHRKLTLKSTLKFGKYSDLTIQQIIDQKHTQYLRWVYYNVSGIDFMEDIKRMIGIEEKDEIPKPGVNPEKGQEITDKRIKSLDFKKKNHFDKINRKKKEFINLKISRMELPNKMNLTRRNQGHAV